MGRTAESFLTGIIIIAILFVLVRPGSQGPSLVSGVSTGLANLVNAATGGGGWSAGSTTSTKS
jgi:hypothetical protein